MLHVFAPLWGVFPAGAPTEADFHQIRFRNQSRRLLDSNSRGLRVNASDISRGRYQPTSIRRDKREHRTPACNRTSPSRASSRLSHCRRWLLTQWSHRKRTRRECLREQFQIFSFVIPLGFSCCSKEKPDPLGGRGRASKPRCDRREGGEERRAI